PLAVCELHRRKRALPVGRALAAHLAGQPEALKARDLAFAFEARGMVRRQAVDQLHDAVSQLQREMGGRCAHQLAHVLDRDLVLALLAAQAAGVFGFAQEVSFGCPPAYSACSTDASSAAPCLRGLISSSESSCACVVSEIAASSPISQP